MQCAFLALHYHVQPVSGDVRQGNYRPSVGQATRKRAPPPEPGMGV